MLKKITLLAMAVGMLAAFALPAAASASWVDNGVALKEGENPKISFTGTATKFTSVATGGVSCNTVAEITLTGGTTTGFVNKFEPNGTATAACVTSGLLATEGCVVEKVTSTGLPWVLHNNTPTKTASVTTGTIDLELRKTNAAKENIACPKFAGSDITPGTVTLTPDNAAAISTLTLSGTLKFDPGEIPVTISGVFHVLAPNIGTYGI